MAEIVSGFSPGKDGERRAVALHLWAVALGG